MNDISCEMIDVTDLIIQEEDPKYFNEAQLAAKADAKLFLETGNVASANGWYNYLTGKGKYIKI